MEAQAINSSQKTVKLWSVVRLRTVQRTVAPLPAARNASTGTTLLRKASARHAAIPSHIVKHVAQQLSAQLALQASRLPIVEFAYATIRVTSSQ